MHPEVAGPTCRKKIAEPKRAEIYKEARRYLGKAHAMAKRKIRSPVHVYVIRVV